MMKKRQNLPKFRELSLILSLCFLASCKHPNRGVGHVVPKPKYVAHKNPHPSQLQVTTPAHKRCDIMSNGSLPHKATSTTKSQDTKSRPKQLNTTSYTPSVQPYYPIAPANRSTPPPSNTSPETQAHDQPKQPSPPQPPKQEKQKKREEDKTRLMPNFFKRFVKNGQLNLEEISTIDEKELYDKICACLAHYSMRISLSNEKEESLIWTLSPESIQDASMMRNFQHFIESSLILNVETKVIPKSGNNPALPQVVYAAAPTLPSITDKHANNHASTKCTLINAVKGAGKDAISYIAHNQILGSDFLLKITIVGLVGFVGFMHRQSQLAHHSASIANAT